MAIHVRCEACGHEDDLAIDGAVLALEVRRAAPGDVLSRACPECGLEALTLALRPWRLSENDRRFLSRLRVTSDDTQQQPPNERSQSL